MNEQIYLKDIAGYDEEKEEAKKIIEVLKNYEKYKAMGVHIPKGLILSGNPGVGKTMLAKAIACESNVELYEFESNESETDAATIKSIKELFKKAKENAPSIVFIDELDELITTEDFCSDYSRKIAKLLLTEIDGISSSDGILVIATTNHRNSLPRALLRSGRMDKRISMEMPDAFSREAIFKLYLNKYDNLKHLNPKILGNKTMNFSGADIKTLINETLIDCASKQIENITLEDFERNIPVVLFQDIKKINKNGPSDIVCYHEIGHFICEYKISGTIGSISTETYGNTRGHVAYDYDETMKLECMTKSSLNNKLTTVLGGLAGEEVLFGDVSNGSSTDLNKARDYIESFISCGCYGFDVLPPAIDFGSISSSKLCMSQDRIAKRENIEVKILNEAYENSKRIIQENKNLAQYLFNELKAKEKLSNREVKEILENFSNTYFKELNNEKTQTA